MNIRAHHKDQIFLAVLWCLVIFIINPIGDFPLNDDWAYAKSIKLLKEEGLIKILNWGEMTLVAHLAWGYLFSAFSDFSFTVLRFSTLVMGLGAVFAHYAIGQLLGLSRSSRMLFCLIVMFNPVFLVSSFSYMTDVPFLTVYAWSFYFFLKGVKSENSRGWLVGILLCCWVLLIRQLALVLPLAWFICHVFYYKRKPQSLLKMVMPLVIVTIFYWLYAITMSHYGLLQERYNEKFGLLLSSFFNLDPKFIINTAGYFVISLVYLGLFFLPILLLGFSENRRRIVLRCIVSVCVTAILVCTDKLIPCLNGVLVDFGVGPVTLVDHYGDFSTGPSPQAPFLFWLFITFLGSFGATYIFTKFLEHLKSLFLGTDNNEKQVTESFSLFSFLIYLLPLCIVGVYDRYLLSLFPMMIFLTWHTSNKELFVSKKFIMQGVFVLLMAVFSVCAVHDYVSWNRARWALTDKVISEGMDVNNIDGGVEYMTWYHFDENVSEWWKEVEPKYQIVFKADTESLVVDKISYSRWLPGKGQIYLVRIDSQE